MTQNSQTLASGEEARNTSEAFYTALEALLAGRGTEDMSALWHHADWVSTVHPLGRWARGWNEVLATWREIAAVFSIYRGHDKRADRIGSPHHLSVEVCGDTAYSYAVFESCLYMPEGELKLTLNETNILHRFDGQWKVVHHHADQAPAEWQERIRRMVAAG
ncbi:MAG TPA: nuclear transport factor 2 family protein [Polyangiaceae bacterium]